MWKPAAPLALALALSACQSSFVYFPTTGLEGTPSEAGLEYDDVHLTAADGVRIHAWYVRTAEREPDAVVLLCHGNGGNLTNWLGLAGVFTELGFDVLLFDYRGYGDSEGSPDEEGTYLDAEAAWDHLVSERRIPAQRIVVYGRSLGGAVASHLAATHAPGALIVDSSFTAIRDFAMENYPRLLVRLGLTYEYDNVGNVRKIRCPLLVIHGRDDELVPFRHGEAIFAAASEPKLFLALDGGHNDSYLVDAVRFRQGIADFVAAYVPPKVIVAEKEPAPTPEPVSASPPPAPQPMTFDEAWAWLRAELPEETSRLRPLETADGLLDRLLGWAAPDATINVFDRSCRRLALTRNERSLDGPIHLKTLVRGKTKTVSGDSIGFDRYITVVCSFENMYERTAAGWVETGASATGCADTVGHGLSEVSDTAAWYGGATVTISPKCILRREQEQRCVDGSVRTCATCERIGMELDSRDGHFHSAIAGVMAHLPPEPTPTDCAIPCPEDARGEALARVNAALGKVQLLQTGLEEHPTLFRTRAACQAYAKRHKMTADDRAQW